jgi:hypothetical protein
MNKSHFQRYISIYTYLIICSIALVCDILARLFNQYLEVMIAYNIIIIIGLCAIIYKSNFVVDLLVRNNKLYILVMVLLVFSLIPSVQNAMVLFEVILGINIPNFSSIQTRFLLNTYWSFLYFLFILKMIIWKIKQ